jgi:pimeloyl-ACP methyl ester carboxylesterase
VDAAVLLIHSSGFTSRQWRKLAESLPPLTTRVIAPELLGYGGEPWPDRPFHFREDVEHLAAQLDGRPAHIVGHSYGGFLALHLALAHPHLVRSLAVYEPVAFGVLDETDPLLIDVRQVSAAENLDLETWLSRFVDWWNGAGAWQQLAPHTQQAFRDVGPKLMREVESLSLDTTTLTDFARITQPTLILCGEATRPAERAVCDRLAGALPNAQLQTFPNLGHMGPIVAPTQVNAAIVAHIEHLR